VQRLVGERAQRDVERGLLAAQVQRDGDLERPDAMRADAEWRLRERDRADHPVAAALRWNIGGVANSEPHRLEATGALVPCEGRK
jgi:hypothetical protein